MKKVIAIISILFLLMGCTSVYATSQVNEVAQSTTGKIIEIKDKELILKKKKESYGYACLTKEKRYYMENHPGVAVENGSLDEVIVMMIQGETV